MHFILNIFNFVMTILKTLFKNKILKHNRYVQIILQIRNLLYNIYNNVFFKKYYI